MNKRELSDELEDWVECFQQYEEDLASILWLASYGGADVYGDVVDACAFLSKARNKLNVAIRRMIEEEVGR